MMQARTTKLFAVLTMVALTLALFAGNVLANAEVPAESSTPEGSSQSGLAQMVDRMGQETWGKMIQQMIQIHGPEQAGQMIQWMSQEDMPCDEGSGSGHVMMGHGYGGMMGQRFNESSGSGSMMGNAFGR